MEDIGNGADAEADEGDADATDAKRREKQSEEVTIAPWRVTD